MSWFSPVLQLLWRTGGNRAKSSHRTGAAPTETSWNGRGCNRLLTGRTRDKREASVVKPQLGMFLASALGKFYPLAPLASLPLAQCGCPLFWKPSLAIPTFLSSFKKSTYPVNSSSGLTTLPICLFPYDPACGLIAWPGFLITIVRLVSALLIFKVVAR